MDHPEDLKFNLPVGLLKRQAGVKSSGGRAVILFEGRDDAGKGGTVKRSTERNAHPPQRWKLSPIDMAWPDRWPDRWGDRLGECLGDCWGDCTHAREAMFVHCDTSDALWTVIKPDCRKRARLNALRCMLRRLPYPQRDLDIGGSVRPLIVGRPSLVASNGGEDRLAE